MDNGAIGFFLFFVILIIIWIFAMGGCVRERNSLGVYEGMTKSENNKGKNWSNAGGDQLDNCENKCLDKYYTSRCQNKCENNY